jgi:hypothetical protein
VGRFKEDLVMVFLDCNQWNVVKDTGQFSSRLPPEVEVVHADAHGATPSVAITLVSRNLHRGLFTSTVGKSWGPSPHSVASD